MRDDKKTFLLMITLRKHVFFLLKFTVYWNLLDK